MKIRLAATAAILALASALISLPTRADDSQDIGTGAMGRGGAWTQFKGGEAVFKGVCQGCHMTDAKGAVGAGMYPALAKDANLETAAYPVSVIVNGQKAMPPLKNFLSDQQVADVVNYIRSNFGNRYKDKVTAADVKTQR